jgi:photosynthetic reaction center cytochrome c subunit
MAILVGKKQVVITIAFTLLVALQSFAPQGQGYEGHEKPKNLQIIYPDISHDDLMMDMKSISRALGVECRYCHVVVKEATATEKPVFDAASDNIKQKVIAREMMRMTNEINTEYFSKITGDSKAKMVTCVTCHMGRTKPVLSVDSLFR